MGLRTARPAVVATGLLCAAIGLSGCSGDRESEEGRKIEAVVKRFAVSSGPDACSLMTAKALTTVYGHGSLDPAAGRARCVAASKRFSGEAVTVTFVNIKDATTANATARAPDGNRYFSVGLEKRRGRWLINAVTPRPRPG